MNRIARALVIFVLASAALMIFAPSASAATGQACHSHKVVKVTGARTVTTETKDCTKDRGGYSHSTRVETCTRSHAGNACTSTRTTLSRSVSVKGKITDTRTVTLCTKSAGKSSVCTTDTSTLDSTPAA